MKKLLFAATLLSVSLVSTWGRAQDNPATLNRCWGDIVSQIGRLGAMGEHSSSHGLFTPDPGDGGRRGVGNVTQEDFGALKDGGQGTHAITNGALLGSDFIPDDAIESQIGPLECEHLP
jgi:hypothetical protein